ncbi:hypothetical protein CKAH01_00402 [Colletotrichum kahawae]|uniref:Uncharacterized protein n=1 Tax=Colletotrichum kahawae TaxID=34407 RepID=A0AAD9YYC6_COLKA|nr:hypothetical protein CKAH01_00402 [Colletotrichum kahawae]
MASPTAGAASQSGAAAAVEAPCPERPGQGVEDVWTNSKRHTKTSLSLSSPLPVGSHGAISVGRNGRAYLEKLWPAFGNQPHDQRAPCHAANDLVRQCAHRLIFVPPPNVFGETLISWLAVFPKAPVV